MSKCYHGFGHHVVLPVSCGAVAGSLSRVPLWRQTVGLRVRARSYLEGSRWGSGLDDADKSPYRRRRTWEQMLHSVCICFFLKTHSILGSRRAKAFSKSSSKTCVFYHTIFLPPREEGTQMNYFCYCYHMVTSTNVACCCLQLLTQACVSLSTGCLFESQLCSSSELCVNGKISGNVTLGWFSFLCC